MLVLSGFVRGFPIVLLLAVLLDRSSSFMFCVELQVYLNLYCMFFKYLQFVHWVQFVYQVQCVYVVLYVYRVHVTQRRGPYCVADLQYKGLYSVEKVCSNILYMYRVTPQDVAETLGQFLVTSALLVRWWSSCLVNFQDIFPIMIELLGLDCRELLRNERRPWGNLQFIVISL